ncbi:MAG TPA: helix-turn-helix domain-containing protein [Pyrinomonadaceae bacterium]|nr:helix-turn-helix domain-containing protein [Pyrinomonadaceae bacterium]
MSKDETKLLSVKQAAAALGVNRQRVQQLIESKRLPAEKVGAFYVIREKDLELVRERRAGRPSKAKAEISKARKKSSKK